MIHLNSKKVLIVDLDNCLCDDRKRAHLIDWDARDMDDRYEAYHAACGEDDANAALLDTIQQAQQCADHMIIFITARPIKFIDQTRNWLAKFSCVKYHLYMRTEGDHRPSPVYKTEVLRQTKKLFGFNYDDCIAFDDHVGVLAAYFSEGLRSVVHLKCHDKKLHTENTNLYRPLAAACNEDVDKIVINTIQDSLTKSFTERTGRAPVEGDVENFQPPVARDAADLMEELAALYRERNAVYGSNYRMVGPIMKILFPEGVNAEVLGSNQFHLFELIIVKLSRFAISQLKHEDSIKDAGVYCAMIDAIILEKEGK